MLGKKIDYWLLRPLVHSRNRTTEEDLNRQARSLPFNPEAAQERLARLISRFGGNLRIQPNLAYLDVGCGLGDLTLALVQAGALDVTGIDLMGRNIQAARIAAEQQQGSSTTMFIQGDIRSWEPHRRFDVIISNEALEHIDAPDRFIRSLVRLLKPDGRAFLAFGPLFHSPFGDHLWGFFRLQIPWRGILFSQEALLRLRQEFFRPGDGVSRFQDVAGGLNLMRYSDFIRYVTEAGLEFEFLSINPQAKQIWPASVISRALVKLPWVRDYFAMSVYATLKRSTPHGE